MGSSSKAPLPASAFLCRFRAQAGPAGVMTFAHFMQLALYDAETGYYRKNRRRIGREPGTDFYTATSTGDMFGELIVQSCLDLAGADFCAGCTFVEIGAEPDAGILHSLSHPFAGHRTIRAGEPISLSGPCIVFSNELFDAQPCRRFVRRDQRWLELGVTLRDESLVETALPLANPPAYLPAYAPDGYVLDAPQAASELMQTIVNQPWAGLFIACDYGKSWQQLSHETPQGTVRAYHQHRQSNALLDQPGNQDLTCHVCWDWLERDLRDAGFQSVALESQESFFIRHAPRLLETTAHEEARRLSSRKLALMQLIHPAHMGQKFQVLHAVRGL